MRHAVLLCNLAAIAWLGLCYASSVIHPATIKYLALFSLTIPFALLANVVFVFVWLLSSRKWMALLSLTVLVFCWKMIPAVFGIHYFSENDWRKTERSFKLMTWNVHAMGIFSTPHEKEHAHGILQLIKQENPDILCLPEFAINMQPVKSHAQKIMKDGGYKAYQFNVDNSFGRDIRIGTALFSKYPVVNYKSYELSSFIYLVENDINIHGTMIRVIIVHLRSFGLSDRDKAVIEEVTKEQSTKSIAKSKPFVWKFNQAYVQRAREAAKARSIIETSPYPVIICGDFNDLPYSYTYATIRGNFEDAFAQKGRGFGRTYNQIIPTLRIDHILYDNEALKLKAFKTLHSGFSDHSPVMARFEITQ